MIILGISGLYHDSAAVLLKDGEIIAGAQEERFTRVKHDEQFPVEAIKFCLKNAGISLNQVDAVAFYDKPLLKFERILESHLAIAPKGLATFISSMPVWMKEKMFFKKLLKDHFKKIGDVNWEKTKLLFPEHHLSHAASSYYVSGFQESAILTIDGVGEWATTSICYGKENTIEVKKEINFPHSVGLLYSSFTYYLGFKVNSGEYKLMGLAPYGDENSAQTKFYIDRIKESLVSIKEDGSFQLNMSFFKFVSGKRMSNDKKWETLFSLKRRKHESEINQSHCNLALAIQKVTEELVVNLAKVAKRITNSDNICLAGGVALNCVANGVLERLGVFKNHFIQSAAGDAGGALGAALAADKIYFENHSKTNFTPYLGSGFSNDEIEAELKRFGAVFKKEENIFEETAKIIDDQNVVGWFQGRSEFGPRALGNRSIIGDPRSKEMQRKINLKIKFREDFRPFAPSVLKESVSKYFQLEDSSPYMLLVHPVIEEIKGDRTKGDISVQLNRKNCTYPAITHVDNSARIQTVSEADNPLFYKLIKAFGQLTGCDMLINTSFNVRGEPIVNSPSDACRCFMQTEMDVLVIGDFILKKQDQPKWEGDNQKIKLD